MTKACSNRIILALLAIGLWVYFVIICFDCQPAIAAIRDKKDPTTRSRSGGEGTTTPKPEEIVVRWRAFCRRSGFHDDEDDREREVHEWSEALTKCELDMPADEDGSKMVRVHVQHPFARLARAYFEYANDFNEVPGRGAAAGDGEDDGDVPSPENFLRSIFHSEDEGGSSFDVIRRPQSSVCSAPICSSRKIDVPQDKILVKWSGDEESTSTDDEKLFWRGVGPRLVKAAFLRYRDDFDIFGYDIGRYFRRLGLKS